jgi:hypothetical protein
LSPNPFKIENLVARAKSDRIEHGHGVYQKIETVILSAVRYLLLANMGLEPSLWIGHYLSRPPGSVNVTLEQGEKWKKVSHTSEFYYSAAHRTRYNLVGLLRVFLEHLGTIFMFL